MEELPLNKAPMQPIHSKRKRFFVIGMKVFGVLCLTAIIGMVAVFAYIAKDLPKAGAVNKRFIAESTKIFDRTGSHLLYELHGEEKRTIIPFSDIPEVVRAATISLEDQEFYNHIGVQPKAVLRAALRDIITLDTAQGGSTITQQFVKNSLLTTEQTLTRKIKEVILSIEIEAKYSKDEILAMYLNEIPYGSNAYGIEAAAQTFFGKPARDLSLDEAALLAALPKGPTLYSPYGSRTDRLIARRNYALQQMERLGYISPEARDSAMSEETLEKLQKQRDIIAAPHFVMYVKEYLVQEFGEEVLEQGGLRVHTTLDWDKQIAAEETVRAGVVENERWRAENAALVAMDPKTGQILAMVGSKDYFSDDIDGQVNVAIRDRQPGSSFKPYVYLTAFTKGYLPETILYDTKTQFETAEGKSYEPQNYNGKYSGPLPIARALGGSLNIPAVKTLYLVGVKDAILMARNLGISTLHDPDKLGLSLVLGGGEVKLLDHVHAYSTLATGGVKYSLTAILRIEDAKGVVMQQYESTAGERVVEEKYVAMLTSVLANNDNRAWVFGENSPLAFKNRQVAAKTGTTNEFRDGWTIGFTPSLAVGVWAGNNDNRPMKEGADGVNVAAPIWRAFLDKTITNYALEEFPQYDPNSEIGDGENKTKKPMLAGNVEQDDDVKVCEIPDQDDEYCRANKYCPDDEVKKKDFISPHDILYYVDRNNPRGPIPDKPDRDPQYKNWEKGVKEYYKDKKGVVLAEPPEDECDEDDFKKYLPRVSLTTPGSVSSSTLTLSVSTSAPYGVSKVSYQVDDTDAGSSSSRPYSVRYTIPLEKNNKTLTVSVTLTDDNGNKATAEKSVAVSFDSI